MKNFIQIVFLLVTITMVSQEKKEIVTQEIEVNSLLKGTLFLPEKISKKTKLVILIAGSGPTNRNGNSTIGGVNNSLKFLAEGLTQNGIAVFSYDKRGLNKLDGKTIDEKSVVFEDFINDAKDVIAYFKVQKKYAKIIIAGHSEGSLIGMVAANGNADGYVSIAGPGRPIDEILSEQIAKNSPAMKEAVDKDLAILKEGKTFENKNPMLASLFRESIQPYMISWIKYNPISEIKKLHIPILIINGTKDIQVPTSDAELLHNATPKSELKIIENMNHIFKEILNDDDNIKSYSNSKLPVIPELITCIAKFTNSI
ncbi:alpha/beta hydrolase [Flavobacterium sp. SUN052]|uniref:alpha/beta hydrolase n=1 Tax=Flavobacterium sp. SUN052 TaxID=3002441 RepID=UPI00237E6408|nr:alpha/beta hydrolase [Flavobacterium sp. SUN052]MEC4005284.1 alpha/beta hydrolase [Flavobacterium sp. SUN052]